MSNRITLIVFMVLTTFSLALAHDNWVQPNTTLVRVGDVVYLDLLMGNHGNHHRDFQIMGKASPEHGQWITVDPTGQQHDLKSAAQDRGMGAKEGFWEAPFIAPAAGLYLVGQASDQVVSYAPLRSIKSAKAFFVAREHLDEATSEPAGFDRVLGHPLELVPLTSPVGLKAGAQLKVQVLYHGQPLAGAQVSCIGQGQTLTEEFDPRHEQMTDEQGTAGFALPSANRYLIVVHHADETAGGEGYKGTKYAATLTISVAPGQTTNPIDAPQPDELDQPPVPTAAPHHEGHH